MTRKLRRNVLNGGKMGSRGCLSCPRPLKAGRGMPIGNLTSQMFANLLKNRRRPDAGCVRLPAAGAAGVCERGRTGSARGWARGADAGSGVGAVRVEALRGALRGG
jgi:hypothetical protein